MAANLPARTTGESASPSVSGMATAVVLAASARGAGVKPTDFLEDRPAISIPVRIDIASSVAGPTIPGSVTDGTLALGRAELARAWEAAGDWLADLAKIEAGEAAELARSLAPILVAGGVGLAWGSIHHSTRTSVREREDELLLAEAG
jgi:hypothetical protein